MKKCSTTPDYKLLEFAENPDKKNIYNLIYSSSTFSKFKYFRLETPRQPYLIKLGAKYVCESWFNQVKTLHTGLIPTGTTGYYFGDFAEMVKDKKKTSLMIFRFISGTNNIQLFYFNHFNKKSIVMKLQFIQLFILNLKNRERNIKNGDSYHTAPNVQTNTQQLNVKELNTNIVKND